MSKYLRVAVVLTAVAGFAVPGWGQGEKAPTLPDGNGKEIVQRACVACHSLNQVTNSGHTPEDWKTVMSMMVNVGAPLNADEAVTVTGYLSKNFPEKPKPTAVVIPGTVSVNIKEWDVPTPGSRPHDPRHQITRRFHGRGG